MTLPTPGDQAAGLAQLSQLAAGNQHIITRPVLMDALLQGNATKPQADAINQFVGGLEAENAVSQLRATGQKVILPGTMVSQLNAIGAQYQDVSMTPSQQEAQAIKQIQQSGQVPVYNNGQLVGQRAQTANESNSHSDGWFGSIGGFWHHLTHNPVTDVFSKAFNIGQAAIGNLFESHDQFQENAALMKSMGYDPSSQLSQMAFAARGFERGDISGVVKQYGQDKVDQAAQYLADPKGYVQNMLHDANASDPSGHLAQQQMATINSKDFGELLQQMGAKQASIGTDIAKTVGLDPVKNPTAYAWLSGGTNFVASFAMDPTLLLGKLYKGVKLSQVSIKGFDDTASFARILDKSNPNMFTAPIQRGFQATVDNGNLVRTGLADAAKAQASGDLKGYAAAQAQVARAQAGLDKTGTSALLPALIGTHRVTGLTGKGLLATTTEGAEPLDTYDKLFDYVTQTHGMLALASGKAAVTASLMPGALSKVGASFVRGALDGTIEKASTAWNFKKLEAASKLMPSADDSVDVASGVPIFPSASALGDVDANLRRFGNMTGGGIGGALGTQLNLGKVGEKLGLNSLTPGSWLNPFAVAARARLVARRLNVTNMLARNNEINLLDELSPAKVQAFGKLYLSDSHANMLAASYAGGDVGARRAIFAGLKQQVFHSAGMYHSEAGTELADSLMREDAHIYAHTSDGIMERDPWTGQQDQSSALWNAQNRLDYSIPSFGLMHRVAAKSGLYESILGRALTSHVADSFSGAFRKSMLMVPRTAARATAEGWVNLLARGNFRAALAAKAHTADLGMLPERAKIMQKATGWWLPKAVSSSIRTIEKRGMSDSEAEYLARVAENHPDIAEQVQESIGQHLLHGDVSPLSESSDALTIAKAGFKPVQWEQDGWKAQSTAGYAGAHRLEAALKLRQFGNRQTFPAVAEYLANPSAEAHAAILDAMRSKGEVQGFRNMRWVNTMRNDQGTLVRATTEDERQVAFTQHADRLISDMRGLLANQDGSLSTKLLDRIREHGVPDGDWINENLGEADRPVSAIAPVYIPKVVENNDDMRTAINKVGQALQDLSGRAYKTIVVNPAERMTSMPSFWMYYAKTRTSMESLEKSMIAEGYEPAVADEILMHSAIRQAWQRTEYTVDDPGAKTQMDIVGRNMVMFPRAVNAFIRRYGQLVRQDPLVIRKAMLSIQGAEQMGLVYKNSNGELTYTVPGSNFLVNALNNLGGMLGYQNFLTLPTGDLTGNLMMSAPGFDNPIRTSLSPMLNIPFRFFSDMFPDHREMIAEIDSALNGPTGAGRNLSDELMPAPLRHFWEAIDPNQRNTVLASATIGAFANLVAADPNGAKGILPAPGSDPTGSKMAAVMGTLKTQVRNQFFMRAALGLFLPGSPSRPEDQTAASHPDEAYYLRGARSMSDEFKMMINDYNGDYGSALQAFVALHPNDQIYTMPTSKVTEAGLNIPATRNSELWMEKNLDLIGKYPLVAAFFAPPATGKFDANAYQAQLDNGLRKKLSIDEFVNSYELKRSQTTYFDAYNQMQGLRKQAIAAGDTKQAAFLKSNFNQQMAPWIATEPSLQEWLGTNNAAKTVNGKEAIGQLREMIGNGDGSALPGMGPAAGMLAAYDAHNTYQSNHATSSADRSYENSTFAAYMTQAVEQNPQLVGLYGLFRAVDWQALPSLSEEVI